MMNYPVILDSLIIILLAATIVYASILNRRLSRFRDNRAELEKAARSFAEAAGKADAGIKGLKLTTEKVGGALQKEIEKAQRIRDELTFLVEAAESLAERLEGSASVAGKKKAAPAGGEAPMRAVAGLSVAPSVKPGPSPRTPDRDLLRAIENMR